MTLRSPNLAPLADEPVSELRRIPIQDSGEPLVDFMAWSPRLFWVPRHPVFAYSRLQLVRESAARMLAEAAESLPEGLRLAVVEGYRAPQIQQRMHEATRERLRREHPEWSAAELAREAERFSAPIDDFVPPPHTTGGAVDVHLVDDRGELLDFVSPYALTDPRGAPAFADGLSQAAQDNRALLRRAMEEAGFSNYPSEWWHWSFGDQGWAYRGGHAHALYAGVEPPNLNETDFSFSVHETPGF